MNIYAQTHIGMVRKKNEDRYLIKEMSNDSVLLMVADGMGGEALGDVAAEIVRGSFDDITPGLNNFESLLVNRIENANRVILKKVAKNEDLEGMGTTVTCALVIKGVLHWAHVGDSRMYVIRDNKIAQVTTDQNMAQFLMEEGKLTEEEARHHPSRNHLDQCVGCKDCKPDTGTLAVKKGDLLLLTTDGLNGELCIETITSIITSTNDIEIKVESMMRSALDAGGKDNITIVAAEI